jgi:preprotein translocase subunit SecA
MQLLKKVFGSRNERLLKRYSQRVAKINGLESEIEGLTDEQLRGKTEQFKGQLNNGASLDELLAPAFATVREAAKRALGMRHFDVQMIGGMVLHAGKVAEMRTGEGKTLVATLPAYLNALSGKGVHVITVNDYLARRDAEWMRPVFEILGLTVGINLTGMSHEEKQAAYQCDITYGTNNEFGFDYLRDNMVQEIGQRVQGPLNFSIIDEVDSILIDEARTPLIISGQAEDSSKMYQDIDSLIPQLVLQTVKEEFNPLEGYKEIAEEDRGDYTVDEKNKQAQLTEQGHHKVEELLEKNGIIKPGDNLYGAKNIFIMHYIQAALRAHALFKKDIDYVVKDDQVIIVDEHTGRLMDGRRWSDGLHQAVEAKEKATIQLESHTLASITFQNYFRLYNKLSGMTGTADTEAFELQKIYNLEVVVVPTNKPMIRDDRDDLVFIDQNSKFEAILEEIKTCIEKKQPVLVGTASIETSELLSSFLNKAKIKHAVLNAKQHEREAGVIAQAGLPGAITIATNMAGRGTDIVLGGNLDTELAEISEGNDAKKAAIREDWKRRHETVLKSGGLHVLGTERHESRRIDNQLRGRSGRQGDPGSSQFYISVEDNLMRIFAAEKMKGLLTKLGMKPGESIQHPWVNKAIEKAQRKVEAHNYDIRKQLLDYDDVANDQRKVIYDQRNQLLTAETKVISKTISHFHREVVESLVYQAMPEDTLEEQWDVTSLEERLKQEFLLSIPVQQWLHDDGDIDQAAVIDKASALLHDAYEEKIEGVDADALAGLCRSVLLSVIDQRWRDHLNELASLRQGIGLRGYGQKNPIQEYKRESFTMFQLLLESIKLEVVSTMAKLEIRPEEEVESAPRPMSLNYQHSETKKPIAVAPPPVDQLPDSAPDDQGTVRRMNLKVGRNEECPCGSGKKYKRCHGRLS